MLSKIENVIFFENTMYDIKKKQIIKYEESNDIAIRIH